ncbi:MAG: NAD(P)-binding protein, partial [Oligoflexales bacterium]|nr:NAD(P)-binding protein [Oligoflexales bacterium]
MNNRPYDCIVAGGGIAGCLFATRLAQLRPQWRILLLEQANVLGGRMRSFSAPPAHNDGPNSNVPGYSQNSYVHGYGLNSYVHGYGLNLVSSPLFNFILELYKQTLNPQQFPEWLDHNKSIELA